MKPLILWVALEIFLIAICSNLYLLPSLCCIMTSFIIQKKLKRSILAKIWCVLNQKRSNQLHHKTSSYRQHHQKGSRHGLRWKDFEFEFETIKCYHLGFLSDTQWPQQSNYFNCSFQGKKVSDDQLIPDQPAQCSNTWSNRPTNSVQWCLATPATFSDLWTDNLMHWQHKSMSSGHHSDQWQIYSSTGWDLWNTLNLLTLSNLSWNDKSGNFAIDSFATNGICRGGGHSLFQKVLEIF